MYFFLSQRLNTQNIYSHATKTELQEDGCMSFPMDKGNNEQKQMALVLTLVLISGV